MEKWVVRYSAVYKYPGRERLIDLPAGTRVETTGAVMVVPYLNLKETTWVEITITFAQKRGRAGFTVRSWKTSTKSFPLRLLPLSIKHPIHKTPLSISS
jgi:hypothetical protein